MTRKHFEGIAKALKDGMPHEDDTAEYVAYHRAIASVADYLATTNPAFDRAKFIKACEA